MYTKFAAGRSSDGYLNRLFSLIIDLIIFFVIPFNPLKLKKFIQEHKTHHSGMLPSQLHFSTTAYLLMVY